MKKQQNVQNGSKLKLLDKQKLLDKSKLFGKIEIALPRLRKPAGEGLGGGQQTPQVMIMAVVQL